MKCDLQACHTDLHSAGQQTVGRLPNAMDAPRKLQQFNVNIDKPCKKRNERKYSIEHNNIIVYCLFFSTIYFILHCASQAQPAVPPRPRGDEGSVSVRLLAEERHNLI